MTLFERILDKFTKRTRDAPECSTPALEVDSDVLARVDELLPSTMSLRALSDGAILESSRVQLRGLHVDVDILDRMNTDEKTAFLGSIHRIVSEPAFKVVLDLIKSRQVEFSMLQAEIWEHVQFGRATVNGVSLVEEEFAALDSQFADLNQPKDQFDKHSVI